MPSILKRLAPKLGAKVLFEPEFNIVGLIRFRNGHKSYFWHNKFNLNSVSAARVAQDKGYTCYFLRKLGYRVPKTQTFFRTDFSKRIGTRRTISEGYLYAKQIGLPVFVKPTRRSQGHGVTRVSNRAEFFLAAQTVLSYDRVLLVQKACIGRDYRIVVLDGEVISAYERVPLAVIGDGRKTIAHLLKSLQKTFIHTGRDTKIPINDIRIQMCLRRFGYDFDFVPDRNERVQLLDVANLSLGGTTIEITSELHPTVAQLAAQVADDLDLRFAGVDLICPDATQPVSDYRILEVNSAPGLDHYGASGREHESHIDELYLKVLKAVERGAR